MSVLRDFPKWECPCPQLARVEALRVGCEKAAETFSDLAAGLRLMGHPTMAQACEVAARGTREVLEMDDVVAEVGRV